MNANYKIAIALVAGACIGAAAVQGLHAQTTPPGYLISEIEVINQDALKELLPKVTQAIQASGGKYLARGSKITALEGEPPKRVVLTVYDSVEKAQASRTSAAYKDLLSLRIKALKSRSYIVEGVVN